MLHDTRPSCNFAGTAVEPNILMGVQIVVNKIHQGKGLSSLAVMEMVNLAGNSGFDN